MRLLADRWIEKVSPCELQRLKDLGKRQVLAVPEDDQLVGLLAQLALDEAQEVLLVHAGTVMHVGVHLSHHTAHADILIFAKRSIWCTHDDMERCSDWRHQVGVKAFGMHAACKICMLCLTGVIRVQCCNDMIYKVIFLDDMSS